MASIPRIVLLLVVCIAPRLAVGAPFPLTLTTLPFDNPQEESAVFSLLGRYLADALGRPVEFVAAKSYDEATRMLSSGKADVALFGAVAYVKARRQGQVRAILRSIRNHRPTYDGVVIVKRGSGIESLADLKGHSFAWVDPFSGAGYLYPRILLKGAGIVPDRDLKATFVGSHKQVVQKVASGEVDAGACFAGAEEMLTDPSAVVAIGRTEPVPGEPVVVRPGLGSELVKKLRSALMEMATVEAAAPFFRFAEIDGFVPAVDADYDRVDELLRQLQ
ncbi:MAG: phosphate/phosphite/phosphonate ABC transporter substrate-binding protein [Deltaproteobacteria bacterium]|nr:phosphate/phosphite/phosphonate ABC transporter substrate-binding protein [Deltaproteobacteria bacterium]